MVCTLLKLVYWRVYVLDMAIPSRGRARLAMASFALVRRSLASELVPLEMRLPGELCSADVALLGLRDGGSAPRRWLNFFIPESIPVGESPLRWGQFSPVLGIPGT